MTSREILDYYQDTSDREIREDLQFAANQAEGMKIAIDCGCGAGANIAFLRSQDFQVYAFDIEHAAIELCQKRYADDANIILSQDSFSTFHYPKACLVVADASLIFCPQPDFESVWTKITNALIHGGIFCGSFIGKEDSMAGAEYDKDAFWPDVLVFDERGLKTLFRDYEILKFEERKVSRENDDKSVTHFHNYSVVARKSANG